MTKIQFNKTIPDKDGLWLKRDAHTLEIYLINVRSGEVLATNGRNIFIGVPVSMYKSEIPIYAYVGIPEPVQLPLPEPQYLFGEDK